jgi:hypothetical protein
MIIGKYFDGDSDEELKMLQHECYYGILREWITMADVRRLKYQAAPEWADITLMWEQFREVGCFDHRCIQMCHDLIAARFRVAAKREQLPNDKKEAAWYAFFKVEASGWLKSDDFLRSFMIAHSVKGYTAGYDAEEEMFDMMRQRYTELNYTTVNV